MSLYAGDEGVGSPYTVKYGDRAGLVSTGLYNVFVGRWAGYASTTGAYNTFIGGLSGRYNTTGGNNTFLGYHSGNQNQSGSANTFLGHKSGFENESGDNNTFTGSQSGEDNTDGSLNSFYGMQSGQKNTRGDYNTFYGSGSGNSNTIGTRNTFLGMSSGGSNQLGGRNTYIGYFSGVQTEGDNNTFIGSQSGYLAEFVSNSVFLGYKAGYYASRSNTLYIENSDTSSPLIYGEFDNDLVRINGSLESTGNMEVGGTLTTNNLNVSGNFSTDHNLTLNSGATLSTVNLVATGTVTSSAHITSSGTFTSTGNVNVTGTTAVKNIIVNGVISSPTDTVAIEGSLTTTQPITVTFRGKSNGDLQRLFVLDSNNANTDKYSDPSFVIKNSRKNFAWAFHTRQNDKAFVISKQLSRKKEITVTGYDHPDGIQIIMGDGGFYAGGQWVDASSRDLKENITELDGKTAIEAFNKLKPVTYNYKTNKDEPVVGFIAEDVPDVVAVEGKKGLNALEMVALLTKVVQEKDKEMEEMKNEISDMKKRLNSLIQKR